MNARNFFLTLLLTIAGTILRAQSFETVSQKVDSLVDINLPKSALAEVDKLDAIARKNNNAPQQVKVAIYRMTLQSYIEEDALAAIISTLKTEISQSGYPVKPVLQSVLASMYWNYFQQNRYRFYQRTQQTSAGADFTQWDLKTIILETDHLFRSSLAEAKREQDTPITVLDGVLVGDRSTISLRPTLFDLLVNRALDYYLAEEPNLSKPRLPFKLDDSVFFADGKAFATANVLTADTTSLYYRGIKYLQLALRFHLQKEQADAFADLDLRRLIFVHNKSNRADKDSLYLQALQQLAAKYAASPVSADVLVAAAQYAQQKGDLIGAVEQLNRVITLYPGTFGARNAQTVINQVKQSQLSAMVEQKNLPGRPLLALLNYTNVKTAYISIYRITERQFGLVCQGNNLISSVDSMVKITASMQPVQQQQLQLPGSEDYKAHGAEFKIDALETGNYILQVADSAGRQTRLTCYASFKVTGMTYVDRNLPNGQHEVTVTDIQTGQPLKGVMVHVYQYDKGETGNGLTDAKGQFRTSVTNNRIDIALTYGTDTLTDKNKYVSQFILRDQDETDRTVLFSDRQIYRPGQTIYFKAIQMIVGANKTRLVTGADLEVSLKDGNGKELSKLGLKTNEFGSVAGSFVLPQSMLNGNVTISTDDGSLYLQVEEYKRPSFTVTLPPVKESYKPGDSVIIKGNVKAFSGYGLTQARVAYHVTRTISSYRPYIFSSSDEIKSDTIQTSSKGDFTIKFKAEEVVGTAAAASYNYAISADVTDASGETHSAQTSVAVSKNNIVLNTSVPARVFADNDIKIPVSLSNLNRLHINGNVRVQVFALKNPPVLFKDRDWQRPDKQLLDSQQFVKQFPDYAYKSENLPAHYKVLDKVADLNLRVTDTTRDTINLNVLQKQLSGEYKLLISAVNDHGDTTSYQAFINLVGQKPVAIDFNNWVAPVKTSVVPGAAATFLVGINAKCQVLTEVYADGKIVSSAWSVMDGYQKMVSIPTPVTANNNMAVQFMMIYHNRTYTSYLPIYTIQPSKNLDMKFVTFHDRLLPGQKEEWKIQIKGTENEAAEMVAGLYDASLDDVTPAQRWSINSYQAFNNNLWAFTWYASYQGSNITRPVKYRYINYGLAHRNYLQLNLFNYSYYGGYNAAYHNYQAVAARKRSAAQNDEILRQAYGKNAALIKNGYDISGTVVDGNGETLPGVSITIKGTSIGTTTNSTGKFRIKVPVNGVLTFNFIGYLTQQVTTTKAETIDIKLAESDHSLREVAVMGYSTQKRANITGAVSTVYKADTVSYSAMDYSELRESQALSGAVYGLQTVTLRGNSTTARLNGKDYIAGFAKKEALPADIIDKIQVVDDYGDQASKSIALRLNFAETAFFYPQLVTNAKGEILIEFTIPDALTKWHFQGLAHTKDLKTGYLETTVVTQKQLSIAANTPRFLREGDTITLSARLANLTAGNLKGRVTLKLFNALNMQPVNLLANPADASQPFEVAGATNKPVSFKLTVPKGIDAITYRLTADAGTFSDGEENTIPVLPNRMLVTESMPMMLRPGQTKTYTFDKLVNQHSSTLQNKTLTLEYSQNPAWYAVQALPYMMEFPYECSEQVFSRYYANSLATNLVNSMPAIKRVFDNWKNSGSAELTSNLEKNPELKQTLVEETPWLRDAINEDEQKKRIALLFDLNKMNSELDLNLDKLQKKQLGDGGFPWFGGDHSDRFITQHILEGIGQLYHLNIKPTDSAQLKTVANNALSYLDGQLMDDYERAKKLHPESESTPLTAIEIHGWFARSYFPGRSLSSALKPVFEAYIKRAISDWKYRSIYEQGMIALTLLRHNHADVAKMIERSLLETAQQTEGMGMYWGKNQLGYFWYQSPVETQCLMIALFTETGNAKAVDEMKIWLLLQKQTNNWKTTKATAAACYALLLKGSDWLADSGTTDFKLNGQSLEVLKPGIKADAGTGYFKTTWVDEQVKPDLGKVNAHNEGKTISWGAMYWQYLENLDKVTPSTTDISLERKYFIQKQSDNGPQLTAVDATHQPKVGDLLKVVVYLKAGRDYEYVQLKDMRPSGTEPVDVLSAYKQQDGLYYYQVTKDVATNFFISYLNKGNYVFEYSLRVAQQGNFSTGISSAQSMYAPEFSAHSEGERLLVH